MLQENIVVEVEKRNESGKNAARRYRAADQIPAVLYGGGATMEPISLCVPRKALVNLLNRGISGNAIFQLKLAGTDQQRHVMIRDLTLDPVSRKLLHVDFVRVLLDKKLRVKAHVELVGSAYGVKIEGGIIDIVSHEIAIECLPADIPASIKVDVSELKAHEALRVQDLKLGDKIRVLDAPGRVVVRVGMARVEEVAATTDAAVVVAAPAAAGSSSEPEVIKKGKKDEEVAAPAAGGAKKEKK